LRRGEDLLTGKGPGDRIKLAGEESKKNKKTVQGVPNREKRRRRAMDSPCSELKSTKDTKIKGSVKAKLYVEGKIRY